MKRMTWLAAPCAAGLTVGRENSSGSDETPVSQMQVGGFTTGYGVSSDPCLGPDTPWRGGIAIDSRFMYVAGYDRAPGNFEWRIEKRSSTSGDLIAGFGVGGVVTAQSAEGNGTAPAAAVDSSALYVTGPGIGFGGNDESLPSMFETGTFGNANYDWRIEKRTK